MTIIPGKTEILWRSFGSLRVADLKKKCHNIVHSDIVTLLSNHASNKTAFSRLCLDNKCSMTQSGQFTQCLCKIDVWMKVCDRVCPWSFFRSQTTILVSKISIEMQPGPRHETVPSVYFFIIIIFFHPSTGCRNCFWAESDGNQSIIQKSPIPWVDPTALWRILY